MKQTSIWAIKIHFFRVYVRSKIFTA